MQIGDVFNIIWIKTKYRCRIIEIILSVFDAENFYIVDLLRADGSVRRIHFFRDLLMELKKQAGPTWSVKPRYRKSL